jgi:hypothetical protein
MIRLPARVKQRDANQQSVQAELKPAAFAFRRIGFWRLGSHRRIIRRRGLREQGCSAAGGDSL